MAEDEEEETLPFSVNQEWQDAMSKGLDLQYAWSTSSTDPTTTSPEEQQISYGSTSNQEELQRRGLPFVTFWQLQGGQTWDGTAKPALCRSDRPLHFGVGMI